jgi:hypothetical protein
MAARRVSASLGTRSPGCGLLAVAARRRHGPASPPSSCSLLTGSFLSRARRWCGVAEHPWFAKLDWSQLALRKLKAPHVPEIKSPTDGSNFFSYPEVADPNPDPDSENVLDECF